MTQRRWLTTHCHICYCIRLHALSLSLSLSFHISLSTGPVDGVVFADAYLITADTATELLGIHDTEPFANAETVLSELQRRGRCFATMPRLALQTWLDSSIQPDRRVGGFHSFFTETYHARYPTTLYDYDNT